MAIPCIVRDLTVLLGLESCLHDSTCLGAIPTGPYTPSRIYVRSIFEKQRRSPRGHTMYLLGQSMLPLAWETHIEGPGRSHYHPSVCKARLKRRKLKTPEGSTQHPSVCDGGQLRCQRVSIGELALLAEVAHSVQERTDTQVKPPGPWHRLVGQESTVGHGSAHCLIRRYGKDYFPMRRSVSESGTTAPHHKLPLSPLPRPLHTEYLHTKMFVPRALITWKIPSFQEVGLVRPSTTAAVRRMPKKVKVQATDRSWPRHPIACSRRAS